MRAVAIGVAVAALVAAVATRPRAIEPAAAATADAARFAGAHLPGATVRTARLSTGAVVAVADRASGFDRSWGSSLLYAEAAREPIELCDRVFFASQPLPLPSGEIVVERGVAGADVAGRVRVDELTLDVVEPSRWPRTHAARTIFATTGFEAHLAALAGDELIVYLVQPGVASLRAIDWRTGRERVVVASLPPYAHDFTMDRDALLVRNRDDEHRERETLERIDLRNGNRTRLETR